MAAETPADGCSADVVAGPQHQWDGPLFAGPSRVGDPVVIQSRRRTRSVARTCGPTVVLPPQEHRALPIIRSDRDARIGSSRSARSRFSVLAQPLSYRQSIDAEVLGEIYLGHAIGVSSDGDTGREIHGLREARACVGQISRCLLQSFV